VDKQITGRVLVTGSAGFIGGYLVGELLDSGFAVVGLDNYSKYGEVTRSYHDNDRYQFVEGDAKDSGLVSDLLAGCDYFIAGAAKIGGISYFHEYAYDLIAENERIIATACDAAIRAHKNGSLKRLLVLSSSMVYENATEYPTPEGHQRQCPPPSSTYGFQKLACEYFVQGMHEQYDVPYTICRPFNCVGIGERRALGDKIIPSGNINLAMSHVVPDLIQKVLRGQDPLRILGDGTQVRCYTYGQDLARGIVTAMTHPRALNQDFNLSTSVSTNVLELAELVWQKIHGTGSGAKPFRCESDEPFLYDVPHRVPDVSKATAQLNFTASTSLSEMLDEVIPWIRQEIAANRI